MEGDRMALSTTDRQKESVGKFLEARLRVSSYADPMSAPRDELHHLVDQLPEDRVAPVLAVVRENAAPHRRSRAVAMLERIRERMHGVTGVDEELDLLRDGSRG
jgi:hypothetical protein